MKCPKCKRELVKGEGTKIYQTVDEHVCDPNSAPGAKEYYVCPTNCFKGIFGYEGTYYEHNDEIDTPYKYWHALESFSIDNEIRTSKEMIQTLPGNRMIMERLKELLIITGQVCPNCNSDMISEDESMATFECLDCKHKW